MKNNHLFAISSFLIVFIMILSVSLISNVQFKDDNHKVNYDDELNLGDTANCSQESKTCPSGTTKSGDYCYSNSMGSIPYNTCVNSAGGYYANGICYKNRTAVESKCLRCNSGYWLSGNKCKKCDSGYWCDGERQNPCGDGYYSEFGASTCSKCSSLTGRYYCKEHKKYSCAGSAPMPEDRMSCVVWLTCCRKDSSGYNWETSSESCGSFGVTTKEACLALNETGPAPVCSKGQWRGQYGCEACSINHYCPDESGKKVYCGDNFVTDGTGAMSASACHCKDGYHKSGNSCVPNSTSTREVLLSPTEPMKQEITYDKTVAGVTGYDPVTCTKSGQKVTCSIDNSFDKCGEQTATVSFTGGGSASLKIIYRGKWNLVGNNVCYSDRKTLTRKNNREKQAWEGEWYDHEKNKYCYKEYYTRCSGGGDTIISQDPTYACYRTSDYKLYWANKPNTSSDVKLSSISQENCNDQNFCRGETSVGKKNIEETCRNTIKVDGVNSGANCSNEEGEFYKITCAETFVAGYLPELEDREGNNAYTLTIGMNDLGQGFGSIVSLKTVKQCTGTFDNVRYNSAYKNLKSKLDSTKSAGDTAGERYYSNQITTLQSYVESFNNNRIKYVDNSSKDAINVTGKILFKYNSRTERQYDYEVKKDDYNVQTVQSPFACEDMGDIGNITTDMEDDIICEKECTTSILTTQITENCIQTSTGRCKGRTCATTINEDCQKEIIENCKKTCENEKAVSSSKNESTKECNGTTTTLLDGLEVIPFTTTVTESYTLHAPELYLDSSGKNVTPTDTTEYTYGGRKFYLDGLKVGKNYKVTILINNLGMNKSSSITNKDCEFQVTNELPKYRIIDIDNPFVNQNRLNNTNINWKNSVYDFTDVIKEKKETLYTFNLSREDIEVIKNDNVRDNSYLGLCTDNNREQGVIGNICREIYK